MNAEPELRADRDHTPATRPDRTIAILLVLAALVVASVLVLWLWSTASERQPAPPAPVTQAPPAQEQAPVPQPPASAPVQYPVAAEEQPLQAEEIPAALGGLLGTKAAATFLQTDNFARRFAATVDSLGREHSPSRTWPVLPPPGHFLVEERPDGTVIAPENAARYTPLVLLAGTIDIPAAVHLYRRMYPLLQQAYRELGFGERYLNDRVVEVVDLLLATPEPPESPRVDLLPVKGPVPSLQPWVRYQFVDPSLESLGAGQKILVRVGPVNQRRLKTMLAALRKELTAPAVPAAAETPASAPEPAASAVGPDAAEAK
jgi:hypothetical protein